MASTRRTTAASRANESARLSADQAVGPKRKHAAKREKKASKASKRASKRKGGAQVIAFANQKGGVAKTTTALNLAVAFKESGHRVLAIDMDPQGNLTMSQGVDP